MILRTVPRAASVPVWIVATHIDERLRFWPNSHRFSPVPLPVPTKKKALLPTKRPSFLLCTSTQRARRAKRAAPLVCRSTAQSWAFLSEAEPLLFVDKGAAHVKSGDFLARSGAFHQYFSSLPPRQPPLASRLRLDVPLPDRVTLRRTITWAILALLGAIGWTLS